MDDKDFSIYKVRIIGLVVHWRETLLRNAAMEYLLDHREMIGAAGWKDAAMLAMQRPSLAQMWLQVDPLLAALEAARNPDEVLRAFLSMPGDGRPH